MSRFLGIDYGLERVGLAISDPDGKIAFPLGVLRLADFGSRKALLDALAEKARNAGAEALVIGLPLSGKGAETPICSTIRKAAQRIGRRLPLPLSFMPEELSSWEAETDLREAGLKGAKLRAALDAQAACRILSSFLSGSGEKP